MTTTGVGTVCSRAWAATPIGVGAGFSRPWAV
jgi:hypothetical protein